MQNNYKVIRLTNNITVVGDTEFTPNDVLIANPLEIYSKPLQDANGKVIGEQMVLRPLLVMTQDQDVVIDSYNILYTTDLDERLVATYEEMVNTVYRTGMAYDGSAYVRNKEPEPEYTKEEAEYMKEVLDKLLRDDVIH
jgi:hypothetical protein